MRYDSECGLRCDPTYDSSTLTNSDIIEMHDPDSTNISSSTSFHRYLDSRQSFGNSIFNYLERAKDIYLRPFINHCHKTRTNPVFEIALSRYITSLGSCIKRSKSPS